MASQYYVWRRHNIHYQKRGMGDPLLLVHNLYPGASHDEYAYNLDELARHHTVYAIDLLGFGDSDAPRRRYTARLYIDLLADFCREVIGRPTHAMAAGLSCSYVCQAAADNAGLFDRLVFVCPRSEPTGLDLPRWAAPIRHFMLTAPGLAQGQYEAAASEQAIAQYLRNSFHNLRAATPERVERLHYNAWREGSTYAYAGLVVGYLDHPLLDALPKVTNPILLVWGRQARPTPVEHSVRLVALARHCNLRVIENAGAWVHDEQSAQVNKLVTSYFAGQLAGPPRAATA
ncbi:MAG: alpha/beta fold hydrolase [Phycisphaerales bacterium]|nr:alpha/beta fold hydrolase [Phycisphaerales bacterium]